MSLHLTPEIETAVRHYAKLEGVSIETLLSRTFPPLTSASEMDRPSVEERSLDIPALLRHWQQEVGLPPRPDGKKHTSVEELFAQWEQEDSLLTPEKAEAAQHLWEEHQNTYNPVAL